MPDSSTTVIEIADELATQTFPIGPFHGGSVPTKAVEGSVRKAVWRVNGPVQSTMDLLAPLRDQLSAQGFDTTFSCESVDCGGFDFRYATPVLPEPDMHVDLGDYRYLIAERGADIVMLMVSRSATAGFIQVIDVKTTAAGRVPAKAETTSPANTDANVQSVQTVPAPALGTPARFNMLLENGGSVVLEGLDFSSGAANLAEGEFPALADLADWLKANPKLQVAVVGHTDASGGLDINISLSKRRAQSVRQYLINRYGIPQKQIEAEGAGYLSPIASNLTEAGRTKNRRVEVIVTSTQVQP